VLSPLDLALGALQAAVPGWLRGRLTFASVIEEECTGNGTLAAARAGVLADAAVLLEPTDLGLLLGGVGILWAELTVRGLPALAYGPRARNIHATDEAVELDSIVAGARTLGRFLAGYYATGGLPAGSPR